MKKKSKKITHGSLKLLIRIRTSFCDPFKTQAPVNFTLHSTLLAPCTIPNICSAAEGQILWA